MFIHWDVVTPYADKICVAVGNGFWFDLTALTQNNH